MWPPDGPSLDPDALRQRAETRWAEIVAERPDLAEPLRLQRRLIGRLLHTLEALSDPPTLPAPPEALADRLRRGEPALGGAPVPLPMAVLAPAVRAICDDLAAGGAGPVATRIRETLDSGRIQCESLLSASLARDIRRIRNGATQVGLAPDLLWLVAELGVGPVAHRLQAAVLAAARAPAGDGLSAALAQWQGGRCPICGSWPAFADCGRRGRTLRCSFCSGAWQPRGPRCIYCAENGARFSTTAADCARPGRGLELCDGCRGYLKVLALAAPTPFPLMAIEDLASSDLDVAAAARGYGRPPLPDLEAAPPCPP